VSRANGGQEEVSAQAHPDAGGQKERAVLIDVARPGGGGGGGGGAPPTAAGVSPRRARSAPCPSRGMGSAPLRAGTAVPLVQNHERPSTGQKAGAEGWFSTPPRKHQVSSDRVIEPAMLFFPAQRVQRVAFSGTVIRLAGGGKVSPDSGVLGIEPRAPSGQGETPSAAGSIRYMVRGKRNEGHVGRSRRGGRLESFHAMVHGGVTGRVDISTS